MDALQYIDRCEDGWDCPHAEQCNNERPDVCPLFDSQFPAEPCVPLDKLIRG